jgi:uncharacterized membrane protein
MVAAVLQNTANRIGTLVQSGPTEDAQINVGQIERWISLVAGTVLAVDGFRRQTVSGIMEGLMGSSLLYRGLTGHCHLYGLLGVDTADHPRGQRANIPRTEGVKVEHSVTINRAAADLYHFWRNLENLPRVMRHLDSVKVLDNLRSHWVAKGPMGTSVEWDAEIITERPNELIGWRSLAGSTVDTAGSVHFTPTPGNRGTEVHVVLKYDPPAGQVGAAVAWLFGRAPGQELSEDLDRFKRFMETGRAEAARMQPQRT